MNAILCGILFGMANGLSPGPTLALVVSQTLQYSIIEGVKVSLGALLFGILFIPMSIFILLKLQSVATMMRLITLIGMCFLAYFGIQLLRSDSSKLPTKTTNFSLLINFTSPNAYLFWLTVGTPALLHFSQLAFFSGGLFLVSYYCSLITAYTLIAVLVDHSKTIMNPKIHNAILKMIGFLLLLYMTVQLESYLQF